MVRFSGVQVSFQVTFEVFRSLVACLHLITTEVYFTTSAMSLHDPEKNPSLRFYRSYPHFSSKNGVLEPSFRCSGHFSGFLPGPFQVNFRLFSGLASGPSAIPEAVQCVLDGLSW